MADTEQTPRNRKERRAAAKESGKPMAPPTAAPKLKMSQPDRSKPKDKTLLDLYEEKKHLLSQGQPFDKGAQQTSMSSDGNILFAGLHNPDSLEDDEPIGPIGNAIFWALSLSMLHFTFDVLVYNQYRQEIEWWPIFQRTLTMLPILFALIYLLRSDTAERFPIVRQVFFLVVAVAAGCHTIHVGNQYGYYFVMKRVPPLVTLWLWSVIEMKLPWAVGSVVVDVGYLWWKGYSVF